MILSLFFPIISRILYPIFAFGAVSWKQLSFIYVCLLIRCYLIPRLVYYLYLMMAGPKLFPHGVMMKSLFCLS